MKLLCLLSVIMISCSTFQEAPEVSSWRGRSTSEIENHPYFKNLTHFSQKSKEGIEVITYRDTTPGNAQGHCAQTGGCRIMNLLYCDYHFSTREGKILELGQSGNCPMSRKVIAPRN